MGFVTNDHGDRGKVNGLKNNKTPSRSRSRVMAREDLPVRACVFAFGYGAVEESGGRNRTLSCSVRLTLTAAKKQRLRDKNRQVKKAG